ncbi:hypothetical protein [Nocardia tengchongensis]
MAHHHGTLESTPPPTVLDGVDWPGLTLLLLGVIASALTVSKLDSGIWTLTGITATAIASVTGFVWIAFEHTRYCAQNFRPPSATPEFGNASTPTTPIPHGDDAATSNQTAHGRRARSAAGSRRGIG